jgi:hypothetical protein
MRSLRPSIVFGLFACACGGSTTNGVNIDGGSGGVDGGIGAIDGGRGNGDGGNVDGGGPPVPLPDGGTVPPLSCGDENVTSIAGTWNILNSESGQLQNTQVITITASTFSFATNDRSLTFTANSGTMTLVWSEPGKQTPITTTRTASPLDTGALPLSVGGAWDFVSTTTTGGERCTASVGNAFNVTCNDSSTRAGSALGHVVGQRSQQLGSIFGALGGVWHLAGDGTGSVDVTIRGNSFTAVVNEGQFLGGAGWITMKVCNGIAVGKTRDGHEFAATRQ